MIEISRLDVFIQHAPILRSVNMVVPKGTMVGLIGRNGAGKTTLMRSIMGLIPVRSGTLRILDEDVTHKDGFWRAHAQIGYMPEDRRLVPDLTAEENILVPAWATRKTEVEARLDWIYSLMPEVRDFAPRLALSLSGGQQKLVALARSLMVGERVLLLDEPFEGIAPSLCMRLVEVISALKQEGIAVLISESDYTYTDSVVDVSYVIERGSVSDSNK